MKYDRIFMDYMDIIKFGGLKCLKFLYDNHKHSEDAYNNLVYGATFFGRSDFLAYIYKKKRRNSFHERLIAGAEYRSSSECLDCNFLQYPVDKNNVKICSNYLRTLTENT